MALLPRGALSGADRWKHLLCWEVGKNSTKNLLQSAEIIEKHIQNLLKTVEYREVRVKEEVALVLRLKKTRRDKKDLFYLEKLRDVRTGSVLTFNTTSCSLTRC